MPPMTFTFQLNRELAYTGTSANTGEAHEFDTIYTVDGYYQHGGGLIAVELVGLTFDSRGAEPQTQMGLDFFVYLQGADPAKVQRYPPDERGRPLDYASSPSGGALSLPISLRARAVLFDGPPRPITLTGTVTLRLASPQGVQFVPTSLELERGASATVEARLETANPEAEPILIRLEPGGGMTVQPGELAIGPGQQTAQFTVTAQDPSIGPPFVHTYVKYPSGPPWAGPSLSVVVTPQIFGVAPVEGGVGAAVKLIGRGFAPDATWSIGAFGNPHYVGLQPTLRESDGWQVVIPDLPSGPQYITVTQHGVESNTVQFTVAPPVRLSSLAPTTGPAGTILTLTGVGLSGGRVSIGASANLAPLGVHDDRSMQVSVPALPAGPQPVRVTVGARVSDTLSFVVLAPPVLTGLSPASGPAETVLVLTGEGFTPDARVTIGSAKNLAPTVESPTRLSVEVPWGLQGGRRPVKVTAHGLSSGVLYFNFIRTDGP